MNSKPEMTTLAGIATARGLVAGPVFLYRGDGEIPFPEYVVEPGREEEELRRFERAVADTKRDLENLISVLRERTGRSDVRVFECHLMFLEDPTFSADVRRRVMADHVNAEAAVKAFTDKMRAQFSRMNDPYFRERVRDFDDVERRLLMALTGFAQDTHVELKVPSISRRQKRFACRERTCSASPRTEGPRRATSRFWRGRWRFRRSRVLLTSLPG